MTEHLGDADALGQPDTEYSEPYRPQVHYSPAAGWLNDPNGLVYYAGEYHLFYQYVPDAIDHQGDKHWGHAVSEDLVHWQHLPTALYPDRLGAIWSGSAVVDWDNTSGLRTGAEKVLVAIFTQFDEGLQHQSIAYSNDRGRNWTMFAGNPVIPNPGLRDFRDPKVFWHRETQKWVMVLAGGARVLIYTSRNLIEWASASEFGESEGSHGGVWECPDLFPLAVDGSADVKKWVMLVSVGNGAPNGGSGTQYFIGDFDGSTFTNSYAPEKVLWLDYGRDNYAGVTFSDVPDSDGRRILVGWMSNWTYATEVPTAPWRGAMTSPRELVLTTDLSGAARLAAVPVAELQNLRREHYGLKNQALTNTLDLPVTDIVKGGAFEIQVEVDLESAIEIGLILSTERGDKTIVGFEDAASRLFVDRRQSGLIDFHPHFAGGQAAGGSVPSYLIATHSMRLHLVVDRSSIEVFVNAGTTVMTEQVFPRGAQRHVRIYASHGLAHLRQCDVWRLEPIW